MDLNNINFEAHIAQPPTKPTNVDLTEDTSRSYTRNYCSISEILNLGPYEVNEINAQRLALLREQGASGDEVNYFYTTSGHRIIDLRVAHTNTLTDISNGIRSRVEQASIVGVRSSDLQNPDLEFLAAGLERDGIVLQRPTVSNPHGLAVSGSNYHADEADYTGELRATKLIHSYLTHPATAPNTTDKGLNYTPVHAKAFAEYDPETKQWRQTHILPSGAVALNSANYSAAKYAYSIFEGMQVQTDEDGNLYFLGLEEHAARFHQSAVLMGMPPMPKEQFIASVVESVRLNREAYIQPGKTFYLSVCMLGADGGAGAQAPKKYIFEVEGFTMSAYLAGPESAVSMKVLPNVSRPVLTGQAKTAANYGPYFKEKSEAKEEGFQDIICVGEGGIIQEVSSAAPFFIERDKNGKLKLVTPLFPSDETDPDKAVQHHMLDSITRKTVLDLADALNIEVEKRNIHVKDLNNMTGAFACGTAAGITRINKLGIDDETLEFEDQETKELIRNLYDNLMSVRQGKAKGALKAITDKYVTVLAPNS